MKKATNPQNLKPFKKGKSGNPAGRPVKLPDIDEIISMVLMEESSNKLTRAENIFRKMCIKAETDVRAAEMIFDRAYGKVKQRTELSGTVAVLPITGIQIILDDSKT
jgi:hypothetical protein